MNIQRAIDRNKSVGNPSGDIDIYLEGEMLTEELEETVAALHSNDRVEIVDGCIDIMFVAIGTLHKLGLSKAQIEQCREEVCDSNFSKLPFQKNAEGKVTKGPFFRGPDLEKYI